MSTRNPGPKQLGPLRPELHQPDGVADGALYEYERDHPGEPALVIREEYGSWPGHCQACGAKLSPPDAAWCATCGASDYDDVSAAPPLPPLRSA